MTLLNAFIRSLLVPALLLVPDSSRAQTEAAPTEKEKEKGAMVRIVCVQSLSGDKDEKIHLAKKTEDGEWKELGDLTLRSPAITDWIRVPFGPSHVVRKSGDEFVSLASFTISPDMKGAVLILIPDTVNKNYRLQMIDPAKLKFRKGRALVVNYANIPALVNMGKETKTLAPGKQLVETITSDENGMHRLLIGHLDKDKKVVACYDRFVSSNPDTRKFILLFPDPETGLRAMTLAEFDPLE
jgi:hypothetical protein